MGEKQAVKMLVQCPHCGGKVVVNGFGRKPFNMPVTEVYDALRLHRSVLAAANSLGCSRAYIYKVLKAGGMTGKDAINGKGLATKDNRMLRKVAV